MSGFASSVAEMRELTRAQARQIALRAQLLDADRPGDVVEVAEQLTVINIDPTAAIAPSEDLLLWSRIGCAYEHAHLKRAVEVDRELFEFMGMYRPISALPLLLPAMRELPRYAATREWLDVNDPFRREILRRLARDGPLLSSELPDTSTVPWRSTGWTSNRNVTQMLEVLMGRGEVAVAGRQGRERRWDLAERVYRTATPELDLAVATRLRDERRLGSLGIARAKAAPMPGEPIDVGDVGVEVTVAGVPGTWRVDELALGLAGEEFAGRTALLSPFDRLVHDRRRLQELFEFEYILEMYKPKATRRWGYFALPILHGDRLIGKLDAAANRTAGTLDVAAIHEDAVFTPDIADAVGAEIEELAAWLGLVLRLP